MKEELLQRPTPATQPKKRRDVFYFAHTRTASHVLCRLLSTQPGWEHSDYHFKRAFDFARDTFGWGPLNDASEQHREGFEKLLQEGFDEILREREVAVNKVSQTHSTLPSHHSISLLTTRNRTKPSSSKNTHSTPGNRPDSLKACGACRQTTHSPQSTKPKPSHRPQPRRTQQSSPTTSSLPSAQSS